MAATMATASTVMGLGSSSLSPSRTCLSSGFVKPIVVGNPLRQVRASGGRFTCFQRDWLRRDLNVIGFGLIGWLAPSSIPLIGGKSLTGLFFESIGAELAHFPSPPALTSQFWLVTLLLNFVPLLFDLVYRLISQVFLCFFFFFLQTQYCTPKGTITTSRPKWPRQIQLAQQKKKKKFLSQMNSKIDSHHQNGH
ncbi:unnamed protein product [Malus baccata var. baccata]